MTKAPIEYHSSTKVKIERRPNRSDSQLKASVPMKRPRKQRGDETGKALQIEQPLRGRREDAGLEQADGDIGGEKQVVEFEPAAERQQRHEPAGVARRRQSIEPRRDGDCWYCGIRLPSRAHCHVTSPFTSPRRREVILDSIQTRPRPRSSCPRTARHGRI